MSVAIRKSFSASQVQRMKREMTLGGRIRFARTYAKLSHDQLGKLAGTSRHHLIKLEKGLHKPKPEMVARIADATGVPIELLTDSDDSDGPESMTLRLSRDEYALFHSLLDRAKQSNGRNAQPAKERVPAATAKEFSHDGGSNA